MHLVAAVAPVGQIEVALNIKEWPVVYTRVVSNLSALMWCRKPASETAKARGSKPPGLFGSCQA